MSATKIQNTHCERIAYVYVRQSTPWQVIENRESTERQYHLQERAIQLGWTPGRVVVIDEDQGRSGSTAAHRTGFQHLVSEVGLGKVGIVLMLEASRLARNNSDWYRLIEICGLSATLIADETAVYNPREPNDRLLLGVNRPDSQSTSCSTFSDILQWLVVSTGLRFLTPMAPHHQAVPAADVAHMLWGEVAAERGSPTCGVELRGHVRIRVRSCQLVDPIHDFPWGF